MKQRLSHGNYDICKIKNYRFDREFLELFTNDYLYTFKDYEDKTLFAILYAVQDHFDINMLTRRYKEKIKNLLRRWSSTYLQKVLCGDSIEASYCLLFCAK